MSKLDRRNEVQLDSEGRRRVTKKGEGRPEFQHVRAERTEPITNTWRPRRDQLMSMVSNLPHTNCMIFESASCQRQGYKNALYTIRDVDFKVLYRKDRVLTGEERIIRSLRRLYLAVGDITEYEFASRYFLNWKHWMDVANCVSVRDHVKAWREELERRLRSRAIYEVAHVATDSEASNNARLNAAKWIAEKGWDRRPPGVKGRPSKEERERMLKEEARLTSEVEDDLKRIRLVVDNGK